MILRGNSKCRNGCKFYRDVKWIETIIKKNYHFPEFKDQGSL
jgi:hypothetical protein